MGVRIALGILAVVRAALIYGDGADLAERPLTWRTLRLPRRLSEPRRAPMTRPVGLALGVDRERR